MGPDIKRDELSLVCTVCGREPDVGPGQYEDWTVHSLPFTDYQLRMPTCPDCENVSIDVIFEKHKERILSGEDTKYH